MTKNHLRFSLQLLRRGSAPATLDSARLAPAFGSLLAFSLDSHLGQESGKIVHRDHEIWMRRFKFFDRLFQFMESLLQLVRFLEGSLTS